MQRADPAAWRLEGDRVGAALTRPGLEMPAKHAGHTRPICVDLPRGSVRAGRDPGGGLW
jgi:hypothetical protein